MLERKDSLSVAGFSSGFPQKLVACKPFYDDMSFKIVLIAIWRELTYDRVGFGWSANISCCRWECGLLHVVDSPDIGPMATLAYRIIARTGNLFMSVLTRLNRTAILYMTILACLDMTNNL
jgi:hypothetical protein